MIHLIFHELKNYFLPFCVFRRQEKTVMKLVVDADTDKVLGASMCGPDAPEIMQVPSSLQQNILVATSHFKG